MFYTIIFRNSLYLIQTCIVLNISELKMPVPYSVDLRWRAVWLHLIDSMSYREIAQLLYMSERSVHR